MHDSLSPIGTCQTTFRHHHLCQDSQRGCRSFWRWSVIKSEQSWFTQYLPCLRDRMMYLEGQQMPNSLLNLPPSFANCWAPIGLCKLFSVASCLQWLYTFRAKPSHRLVLTDQHRPATFTATKTITTTYHPKSPRLLATLSRMKSSMRLESVVRFIAASLIYLMLA